MFTSIELISSCTRNVEDSSATMRAFVGHSSSKANSSARLKPQQRPTDPCGMGWEGVSIAQHQEEQHFEQCSAQCTMQCPCRRELSTLSEAPRRARPTCRSAPRDAQFSGRTQRNEQQRGRGGRAAVILGEVWCGRAGVRAGHEPPPLDTAARTGPGSPILAGARVRRSGPSTAVGKLWSVA